MQHGSIDLIDNSANSPPLLLLETQGQQIRLLLLILVFEWLIYSTSWLSLLKIIFWCIWCLRRNQRQMTICSSWALFFLGLRNSIMPQSLQRWWLCFLPWCTLCTLCGSIQGWCQGHAVIWLLRVTIIPTMQIKIKNSICSFISLRK